MVRALFALLGRCDIQTATSRAHFHSFAWCNLVEDLFCISIDADSCLPCTSGVSLTQLNIFKHEVFVTGVVEWQCYDVITIGYSLRKLMWEYTWVLVIIWILRFLVAVVCRFRVGCQCSQTLLRIAGTC